MINTSDPPWHHCPVCHDTRRITTISKDMIRAVRKLRRDLKYCASCSIDPSVCPILQNLNTTIQAAVQEVVDEWNLSP